MEKEEAKNRMLTVQEKTREELTKLSNETGDSTGDAQEMSLSLMQKKMACMKMEQKCDALAEQRRRLEASMKKQETEWKIAAEAMNALVADFEKYSEVEPEVMNEEHPVVIGVSQLEKILGVDPERLPTHCLKCRKPFDCPEARVVLGICCCVDYCRKCVQTRRMIECPRHKVSVGEVMRFTMNG